MKIRPVGDKLFHADWRTKLVFAFRKFANEPKNQLMLCGEIFGFYCEPYETHNTGLLVGKMQTEVFSLKQVIHLVMTACSEADYCHSDATVQRLITVTLMLLFRG